MIKQSRYKKTRKKYKGGTLKLDETQINNILDKVLCAFTPTCILKTLTNEFIFSIKMLNDILLLSGLYVKNLFYLGSESNLNNILPQSICFDLFDETTCNTKIVKLLNIQSLKEENQRLPKELMYRGQRGGSFRSTCKNNQTPGVVCADNRSNINPHKPKKEPIKNPIVVVLEDTKFPKIDIFPDKETAHVYVLNELKAFSIFNLYNILKILRVLYYIDDGAPIEQKEPEQKEPEQYKLDKEDVLRIEHNFKKSKGFKEWQKCNDFHLERNIDEKAREDLVKQCNVKCPDCTMKKQSYLYTNPDEYGSFDNGYLILQKVIQLYYVCDKSKTYNHSKIYELLKDENERMKLMQMTDDELFDYFNIGIPQKKEPIGDDVLTELKRASRLNRSLGVLSIVSKLLLYKLFNSSTPKERKQFHELNLNKEGAPLPKP
jgi:hypothetical protein